MLDNLLNSVKRGAEKVQRRGEEVAQVARLKMEVFQLNRELDGHYARLGRSYHAGAETDLLAGIQADVRRVEDDIQAREKLIEELGGTPDDADTEPTSGRAEVVATAAPTGPATGAGVGHGTGTAPTVPASTPTGGTSLPTPTPGGPFPEAPTPPNQGPTGNTPPFVDGAAEDDTARR